MQNQDLISDSNDLITGFVLYNLGHRDHHVEEKAEVAMESLLCTTDTPFSNRTSCTKHRDVPKNDKDDTISPQIWARIEIPTHRMPTRTAHPESLLSCRFSWHMT